MPQITQSAEATAADDRHAARAGRAWSAPTLTQLAETLSNPLMTDLPRRITETMDVVASLPTALGPCQQMAEMAGGLFGGGRAFVRPLSPSPAGARLRRSSRRRRSTSPRAGPGLRRRKRHPARAATRTRQERSGDVPIGAARRRGGPEARPRRRRRRPRGRRRRTKGRPRRPRPSAPLAKRAAPRKTAAGTSRQPAPLSTSGRGSGEGDARLAVHRVAGRVGQQVLVRGAGHVGVGDARSPARAGVPARRAALVPAEATRLAPASSR